MLVATSSARVTAAVMIGVMSGVAGPMSATGLRQSTTIASGIGTTEAAATSRSSQAQLACTLVTTTLGAALATANRREFSEAQLNEAKAAPSFLRSGTKHDSTISEAAKKHSDGVTPAALAAIIARRKAAAEKLAAMQAAREEAERLAAEAVAELEAALPGLWQPGGVFSPRR